jgi:hypothetical protein
MQFFIGVLALLVICAIFASPAVLLFGLVKLTSDRQIIESSIADPAPAPLPQPRR